MPSASRRRRTVQEDSEDEAPSQSQQRRRHTQADEDEEEADEEEEGGRDEMDVDEDEDSQDQLVKKLVRYALACEYQRMPIRRTGINEKVIGKQRGAFKRTFDSAQNQLRTKFGMQLVELPVREKVTLKERRAQKSKTTAKPSTTYILCSTLSSEYRNPDIMPPSLIGDEGDEAAYVGIYTFIVAIITLAPSGNISDEKLHRYLSRLNANSNMPIDKTEAVIARMVRQNYIFKTENNEVVEWRVGPRGKVEIGNKGVQGLVREVYGDSAPEDLESRLSRSLNIKSNQRVEDDDEPMEDQQAEDEPGPSRRRSGRRS